MKQSHNFVEGDSDNDYRRVVYCTKCGRVAWNYNYGVPENDKLQKLIGPCVEIGEEIKEEE